jgi:hypothetical protein
VANTPEATDRLVERLRENAPLGVSRRKEIADLIQSLAQQVATLTAERFLLAYVSQDAHIVGIEHDTEADWDEVFRAHTVLRDRLNERLAEMEKCPFKPKDAALKETNS